MPQRRPHAPVAVSFEGFGNLRHRLDEFRVADGDRRLVIVGGARNPHQPASLSDGETKGPVTTDVVALLGRGVCFRAPFKTRVPMPAYRRAVRALRSAPRRL